MKNDTRITYTKKHNGYVVTQSDAGDASKIALQTDEVWIFLNRRETLRLIANLVRLLLANLRERSVE